MCTVSSNPGRQGKVSNGPRRLFVGFGVLIEKLEFVVMFAGSF